RRMRTFSTSPTGRPTCPTKTKQCSRSGAAKRRSATKPRRARLKEIVVHARSEDGEVAGVCTAVAMTLPRLGQPLYYYRTFVGEKWRKSRLVVLLLKRAFELLEGYAVKNGYPCIGVVIELENARFAEAGRMPVWPDV